MSAALSIITATAPPSINWRDWIEARAAASILKADPDHMRRRCRETLAAQGLAMYAKPEGGGNPRWWVRRVFDRRLIGDAAHADLDAHKLECTYTDKQRRLAMLRAQCVELLRDCRMSKELRSAEWCDVLLDALRVKFSDLKNLSRSRLYVWDRLYRGPADLGKLIDARGGDNRSKGDPAAWAYFESIYLDDRRPMLRSCWERTRDQAKAQGWHWCSEPSCRRQLDARIPEAKRDYVRDPARYRSQHAPYIKQHPERFEAGRCWVGDHAQLDFWCMSGQRLVRLFASTWLDWRTSRIVGWILSPEPSSATILAAFRMGMLDKVNMGGPSETLIDNGKDYDAFMWDGQTKTQRLRRVLDRGYVDEPFFGGIYGMLNIKAHYSIPYGPNGKAPQERWYRTLHERFCKTFPTYCGSTPEQKPEGLEELLRARRAVPLAASVIKRFADFVQGYNANADHQIEKLIDPEAGNERLSPDEAMRRWCQSRRVFAPGVLDLCLQTWHQPVKVGRHGVAINVAGERLCYGAMDQALIPHKGKTVFVSYDAHALQSVRVYTANLQRITIATANELGGLPASMDLKREHVKRQLKQRRDFDRAMRTIQANPEQQYLSKFELIAHEAMDDAKPTPHAAGPMQLVRTPLDAEAGLRAPGELRKAAGAESDAMPAGMPSLSILRGDDSPRPGSSDDDAPSLGSWGEQQPLGGGDAGDDMPDPWEWFRPGEQQGDQP